MMKKVFPLSVLLCLLALFGAASAGTDNNIVIRRGTEVLLKVMEKIKSNKVSEGQTIQFLVERAVKDAKGFTMIEQGAVAYGTITEAASAGLFGTGGKLAFIYPDGQQILIEPPAEEAETAAAFLESLRNMSWSLYSLMKIVRMTLPPFVPSTVSISDTFALGNVSRYARKSA